MITDFSLLLKYLQNNYLILCHIWSKLADVFSKYKFEHFIQDILFMN